MIEMHSVLAVTDEWLLATGIWLLVAGCMLLHVSVSASSKRPEASKQSSDQRYDKPENETSSPTSVF